MNIPAGTKELTDYGITLTAAQINDAEQQSNKNQPNGYAGLDENGDLVGPIIPQTVTNEVLEANQIAFRGGAFVKGDGTTEGGIWLALPMRADSFVVVERGATDVASGTNLLAAYTAAKSLTPGGNALSATNRAVVFIPPGRYDLNGGFLTLDTQYVDVVGLSTDRTATVITSAFTDITKGTIIQTANDVHASNLTVEKSNDTDGSAYYPSNDLDLTVWHDVEFSASDNAAYSMRTEIEYSGTFIDCESGSLGFGSSGTASGTFIDCEAGADSFGTYGTASGTFIRCRGDVYSFGCGGGAAASGTFIDCEVTGAGFGWETVETSGYFRNCRASSVCFSNATGTFINCDVMTGDGVLTGTAINCRFTQYPGNNAAGILVGDGAKLHGCTVIADGDNPSIDASSAVSAEIANCHTPQGIGANVTNSVLSEAVSWSVSVSGTLATGDGQAYATIPAKLGGKRIRRVHARVLTAGTTGTTDIQIANVTNSVDILSTKLTIDSGETGSDTAATAAVINHSNSLLATNDLLRIDIDAVSTTPPEDLIVTLEAY